MKIEIINQDLMTVDTKYVICHCISADCAMGAGVVVPIKNKYKGIKNRCLDFVSENGINNVVGTAYRDKSENGTVYNLFSKRHVYHNAGSGITVDMYHSQLRRCLESMKTQLLENGEKYLAMPKIACGLDRCKWEDIETIICDVFKDTEIEILVCVI